MKKSRRQFLEMGLTASLAAGLVPSFRTKKKEIAFNGPKLDILILGGTSFLGPHQIAYALERGHNVSIFTRGKTIPKIHQKLFDDVEKLVGDREDNLVALEGRKWDVVIDNSGRKVQWTRDSAELLKDHVGHYMYTSSISVYYPYTGTDFSELRKPILSMPENALSDEKRTYEYGIMKANSEIAALKAFGPSRTISVRPSLIVGPGDRTDRFPYWVARLEKGGEVMIPGGKDEVVQYIDVKDLAEWMIRCLENKVSGTFNASGPGFSMTTNAFVHGVHASFNSPVSYVQVDDVSFLEENGVIGLQPWVIQLPEYKGMSKSDNSKAIESGLTFRPLAETVMNTAMWWNSEAVSQERRDRLMDETNSFIAKEEKVIAKWKNKMGLG